MAAVNITEAARAALQQQVEDYRGAYKDARRVARLIDVAMHGEAGAAQAPSLCDLVGPARDLRLRAEQAEAEVVGLRAELVDTRGEGFECPVCEFASNIEHECPNDGATLLMVTWKQRALSVAEKYVALRARVQALDELAKKHMFPGDYSRYRYDVDTLARAEEPK